MHRHCDGIGPVEWCTECTLRDREIHAGSKLFGGFGRLLLSEGDMS